MKMVSSKIHNYMNTHSYITESSLKLVLNTIYPNVDIIHNRTVPNSNLKYRPDYRIDEYKILVEFDGYLHYTSTTKIKREEIKTNEYQKLGYTIIRLPYFIQIDTSVIKNIFDLDVVWELKYPHGFIDKKALLPCDYCELGILKFKKDLNKFEFIHDDIIDSLLRKIDELGDIDLVLPPSLHYIVK